MDGLHCCGLYESAQDLPALLGPAIRAAQRAGATWSFVGGGIDPPPALAQDHLVEAARLGFTDTPISVRTISAGLRREAEAAVASGHAGLLLVLDMAWLLNTPSGVAHQAEFEAALHALTAEAPLWAVCLYSLKIFPDSLVLDALRIHPFVCSPAGLYRNPHVLPPQAFLSRDPGAKLRSWLAGFSANPPERWQPPTRRLAVKPRAAPSPVAPATVAVPAAAAGARWKIRCFGNLRIYAEDGTPVHWNLAPGATMKAKTLFAFLLNRGAAGASGEELADLLWPEATSTVQALNRLYHTIHCLRVALSPGLKSSRASPHLLSQDHRYVLALPEGSWVDVPVFEEFCRRGEKLLQAGEVDQSLACHLAAEKLYSGRLFADLPAAYTDSVDNDWCWSRRYWLEEIHVKMLTTMAAIYRRLGDPTRAVAYGERALAGDPCFEPAHQEIMRAFHDIGRRDALERQYRLCCAALKRYEERPPAAATRVLFQRLMP